MAETELMALVVYLVGQTIALWRKLDRIEQQLSRNSEEQARQKERLIRLENDLAKIKGMLGIH